jgi:23S rRNA (uridine2552-2'-O)-methyltransferase
MTDYKKPDYWQQKARKEGYPARSVYKLKEIDEKFNLLNPRTASGTGKRILDIGAAPGSWSLYVLRKFAKMHGQHFLSAADLSPLSREFDNGLFDSDNFFFIQGDVTAGETREALLSKGPYSVIISDVAPNTTGNHIIDSARSFELAETVITYAETALVPGGNLAVKVFQGSGIDTLLKQMKTLFTTAKSFKPEACRGESVETYFIGLGKR